MRVIGVLAAVCLAACAAEKLAPAPPVGVDFSGQWKLDVADSDDPQRLIQAQFNTPAGGQTTSPSGGGSGGRNGRQGGGRGGASGMDVAGPLGPAMPPVSAMNEGLRWPGKQLEIKHVAGVVAFSSDGINRVCQPSENGMNHRHHAGAEERGGAAAREPRARDRDVPPPRCGWTDKTLVVQGGDPDEEHPPFEEQYSLSEDGQRLIEVVAFKGGRSSGFTMSRVWDRAK